MSLTGKTIGQLTLLESPTANTLIPVEYNGDTYHIQFSAVGTSQLVDVTYSELVDKITGETLNTGSYYIITDFKTCYDQPDFNSYGNQITGNNYKESNVEPIIVLAISSNTISTTAYQPAYPNDRIQYDWTFNTTEKTAGAAYGRITERIDEFNNRTDYDHRTILFKRYQYIEIDFDNPYGGTVEVTSTSETEMTVLGTGTNFTSLSVGQYVGFNGNSYRVYEITSIDSDTSMVITGLTNTNIGCCIEMFPANSQTNTSYYQNNITTAYTEVYTFDYENTNLNNYVGNFANMYVYDENYFLLANNVFQGLTFRNNTFGDSCYNNTFDDDCENNTVGNYFYNNITDDDFDGNLIGNWFYNNRITSNFQYNRIGENFTNNYLVQNSFYRNNIMNYFNNNIISGDDFQNNEIGSQFNNNILRNSQFYKNDIGNGYNYNKVYYNFYGNLVGNGFNANEIYCQFSNNTIGEYYESNNVGDINDVYSYAFDENVLGPNFVNNTIFSDFYKNQVGVNFQQNSISGLTTNNFIGNQFENNTIYNNFNNNKISDEFKGNMMLQAFESNYIDSFVAGNQFSGNTYSNHIGDYTFDNDFLGYVSDNRWGTGFYSNTIDYDFTYNIIGNGFHNNFIGHGFQYNNIGYNFNNNTVGDNFGYGYSTSQGNRIGSNFFSNIIGEYFYNNSIPDNFHDNEVGDYFQWNVINTNIDTTDFTINYGNLTGFTYIASGTSAVDNLYIDIEICGTTQSSGVEATFDVEVSGGSVIGVSGNTEGRLYKVDDVLTILGTQIGGTTPEDDVVITVTGVTPSSLFYEHYTKQIFERKLGDKRVSYYDENDVLNIDSIYEVAGYIPVYSQSLSFPINYTSFEFWCNGGYTNSGTFTGVQTTNTQDVINLFNSNSRSFGYFFDNNDGTIGLYTNPLLKQQFCPSGTYTLYVFND